MQRGKNKGFTIVEVTLFIAISSLLILTAMITIGSKQQSVQFTDAMRDLQSFTETQVSAALNGVNDNPGTTSSGCVSTGGDSEECVVLGRVMLFTAGSSDVTYHTILGQRLSIEDEIGSTCNGQTILQCSEPETETDTREYNVLWGATFTGGIHVINGAQAGSDAIAFTRTSRSSNVSSVSYSDVGDTLTLINNDSQYASGSTEIAVGSVDAYYCFESANGSMTAALTVEESNVDMIFDHPGC